MIADQKRDNEQISCVQRKSFENHPVSFNASFADGSVGTEALANQVLEVNLNPNHLLRKGISQDRSNIVEDIKPLEKYKAINDQNCMI